MYPAEAAPAQRKTLAYGHGPCLRGRETAKKLRPDSWQCSSTTSRAVRAGSHFADQRAVRTQLDLVDPAACSYYSLDLQ